MGSILCLAILSCNPPIPRNTLRFDFLKNFDKAEKTPGKVFKPASWEKQTRGRAIMLIGVFGEAKYKLLPEQTGDDLYFGLRMNSPDSARAECLIIVETSSQVDTVFKRLMNTAENVLDRNWYDEHVRLSKYKGYDINVRFSVLFAGTDAWVEWGSPILIADE